MIQQSFSKLSLMLRDMNDDQSLLSFVTLSLLYASLESTDFDFQPRKYDSREYGFDEDDQSSISPTTEDGSATRTTETRTTETGGGGGGSGPAGGGEGGEKQGDGKPAVGGATAGLDEHNSLSSYADDFADDESIIPPAQHAATTARPSSENPSAASAIDAGSSGGGDAATQQGVGDRSQHSPATDVPASSRGASSESNTEDNAHGGDSTGNNQDDSNRSRAGNEGVDRRRLSGSAKNSGTGRGDDGGRGAESKVDSVPSVSELEDRLREADLENTRLREAMEKGAEASAGASDDDRRELEILKGQVEAAK